MHVSALQVVAELQERNEAAEAVRGAAVNGQELDELKAEYEQRIATAERKASAHHTTATDITHDEVSSCVLPII